MSRGELLNGFGATNLSPSKSEFIEQFLDGTIYGSTSPQSEGLHLKPNNQLIRNPLNNEFSSIFSR